ncbi:hypothetical protein HPB50_027840 [Hyalomma asiaticum]|nr:hypothetical protein HPB50_027840 [Hyalomma asiaticum]
MSRNSRDGSGATNPDAASARDGQRDGRFGDLTPERRLQELRDEMERLSQMMSGSSQTSMPEFSRGIQVEAPVLFESLESALEAYEVPRVFCRRLAFPLVAERVPYLSTWLSLSQRRDYSVIKKTGLVELKLSAGEYLKTFLGSEKRANEVILLSGRGEVSTFETLVGPLVAGQLKRKLSEAARRYVTLQEGRKRVNAPEMAAFLRTFEEAHGADSAARQLLNEERAFDALVKDAPGVGDPQLPREGEPSNTGTVQQQHEEHVTTETAAEKGSVLSPAAMQSVVQDCGRPEVVGEKRCNESAHENREMGEEALGTGAKSTGNIFREQRQGHSASPKAQEVARGIVKEQSEGACIVGIPARDRRVANKVLIPGDIDMTERGTTGCQFRIFSSSVDEAVLGTGRRCIEAGESMLESDKRSCDGIGDFLLNTERDQVNDTAMVCGIPLAVQKGRTKTSLVSTATLSTDRVLPVEAATNA